MYGRCWGFPENVIKGSVTSQSPHKTLLQHNKVVTKRQWATGNTVSCNLNAYSKRRNRHSNLRLGILRGRSPYLRSGVWSRCCTVFVWSSLQDMESESKRLSRKAWLLLGQIRPRAGHASEFVVDTIRRVFLRPRHERELSMVSTPSPVKGRLSTAEGFICGGIAACMAVCQFCRRSPARQLIGFSAGHCVQPFRGRQNTFAAPRRARKRWCQGV